MKTAPTLCLPDDEKACFACCPPIRPAGYEHLHHRAIIQRMLRENTAAFDPAGRDIRPITGFSCWALGYPPGKSGRVGCLLHPAINQGVDLRFRVDYGEKCRRESCPEARGFLKLPRAARLFWLETARGLDSFSYSSRRTNPLFRILGWGPELLALIAREEPGPAPGRESLFRSYPFFASNLNPRAFSYLITRIVGEKTIRILKTPSFTPEFKNFAEELVRRIRAITRKEAPPAPFVHRLDLDPGFLDFLRLGPGIARMTREQAKEIQTITDAALAAF